MIGAMRLALVAVAASLAAACSSSSSNNGSRNDAGGGAETSTGGTVPPGGACGTDSDCAIAPGAGNTAHCWTYSTADGGFSTQCFQVSPGKNGSAPCYFTQGSGTLDIRTNGQSYKGYSCARADGLRCDFGTYQCMPSAQTGQPCSIDNDCIAMDSCNTTTSMCVVGLGSGQPCTSNQQCGSGICDVNHACR
jgi:hypothetical protein